MYNPVKVLAVWSFVFKQYVWSDEWTKSVCKTHLLLEFVLNVRWKLCQWWWLFHVMIVQFWGRLDHGKVGLCHTKTCVGRNNKPHSWLVGNRLTTRKIRVRTINGLTRGQRGVSYACAVFVTFNPSRSLFPSLYPQTSSLFYPILHNMYRQHHQ